jgi:hypothetical protein
MSGVVTDGHQCSVTRVRAEVGEATIGPGVVFDREHTSGRISNTLFEGLTNPRPLPY